MNMMYSNQTMRQNETHEVMALFLKEQDIQERERREREA